MGFLELPTESLCIAVASDFFSLPTYFGDLDSLQDPTQTVEYNGERSWDQFHSRRGVAVWAYTLGGI